MNSRFHRRQIFMLFILQLRPTYEFNIVLLCGYDPKNKSLRFVFLMLGSLHIEAGSSRLPLQQLFKHFTVTRAEHKAFRVEQHFIMRAGERMGVRILLQHLSHSTALLSTDQKVSFGTSKSRLMSLERGGELAPLSICWSSSLMCKIYCRNVLSEKVQLTDAINEETSKHLLSIIFAFCGQTPMRSS